MLQSLLSAKPIQTIKVQCDVIWKTCFEGTNFTAFSVEGTKPEGTWCLG